MPVEALEKRARVQGDRSSRPDSAARTLLIIVVVEQFPTRRPQIAPLTHTVT
jgi:hypothetical protein